VNIGKTNCISVSPGGILITSSKTKSAFKQQLVLIINGPLFALIIEKRLGIIFSLK
jgi:hypothetical protein